MSNRPFKSVKANRPGRSAFDLSYSKLFTCDMGQLIPIMADTCVPGDHFTIGNEIVVRFQPLVAPILHEVNAYVHYFFVPYRLLWDGWEDFITSGETGQDASVVPKWFDDSGNNFTAKGTLWDYLGFPLDNVPSTGGNPNAATPHDFPRRAYYKIWNEFYRDENLQTEVDINNYVLGSGYQIMNRPWAKDYFTSAQINQQKGTAPALPISGISSAIFDNAAFASPPTNGVPLFTSDTSGNNTMGAGDNTATTNFKNALNNNIVDLSSATTFDVADLRLAFQIQRWLERNQRAGTRYKEFLLAHFGVTVPDNRLQRCEYIGGSKSPIVFSETLQTSETGNTPQGNMAGHGISASSQICGKYFVQEYGLIMGIMSIVPTPMYSQGINRQWLYNSRYEFYSPEFAGLSEQPILGIELYMDPSDGTNVKNYGIFGYQGRYDEMRYKPNMVCADMRDTFDYWHLGRQFSDYPTLNETFIEIDPSTLKRIFAAESEPGLMVSFGNLIKAVRPIPAQAEPGRIDH